jgi:hypothetical protein
MAGNDVIGAIGFGSANDAHGGDTHDEACAKAGLEKIKARVNSGLCWCGPGPCPGARQLKTTTRRRCGALHSAPLGARSRQM